MLLPVTRRTLHKRVVVTRADCRQGDASVFQFFSLVQAGSHRHAEYDLKLMISCRSRKPAARGAAALLAETGAVCTSDKHVQLSILFGCCCQAQGEARSEGC